MQKTEVFGVKHLIFALCFTVMGCETLGFTDSTIDVEADVQMERLINFMNSYDENSITVQQEEKILAWSEEAEIQLLASKRKDDKDRLEEGRQLICKIEKELGYVDSCS